MCEVIDADGDGREQLVEEAGCGAGKDATKAEGRRAEMSVLLCEHLECVLCAALEMPREFLPREAGGFRGVCTHAAEVAETEGVAEAFCDGRGAGDRGGAGDALVGDRVCFV